MVMGGVRDALSLKRMLRSCAGKWFLYTNMQVWCSGFGHEVTLQSEN